MAGFDVTIKRNDDEIARLKLALAYGMLNLGFFIENRAKAVVPYRTGNLRRSIHTVAFHEGRVLLQSNGTKVPDYGQDIQGTGVIVGTNAGYGIFVELGTFKMAARPYLTPAAQEAIAQGVQLITDGAKQHYGG